MLLTREHLLAGEYKACELMIELFDLLFPAGAEVNETNVEKAIDAEMPVYWLIDFLLPADLKNRFRELISAERFFFCAMKEEAADILRKAEQPEWGVYLRHSREADERKYQAIQNLRRLFDAGEIDAEELKTRRMAAMVACDEAQRAALHEWHCAIAGAREEYELTIRPFAQALEAKRMKAFVEVVNLWLERITPCTSNASRKTRRSMTSRARIIKRSIKRSASTTRPPTTTQSA